MFKVRRKKRRPGGGSVQKDDRRREDGGLHAGFHVPLPRTGKKAGVESLFRSSVPAISIRINKGKRRDPSSRLFVFRSRGPGAEAGSAAGHVLLPVQGGDLANLALAQFVDEHRVVRVDPADHGDAVLQGPRQVLLAVVEEERPPVLPVFLHREDVQGIEVLPVRLVQVAEQHGRAEEDAVPVHAQGDQGAGEGGADADVGGRPVAHQLVDDGLVEVAGGGMQEHGQRREVEQGHPLQEFQPAGGIPLREGRPQHVVGDDEIQALRLQGDGLEGVRVVFPRVIRLQGQSDVDLVVADRGGEI